MASLTELLHTTPSISGLGKSVFFCKKLGEGFFYREGKLENKVACSL
jgi:hypothetical protein